MVRIAVLKANSSSKGGLEKTTRRLVDGFRARGAEVSLLTQSVHGPRFLQLERYDRYVQRWINDHHPDLIFGMERNRIQTHFRAGNGVHAAYLHSRGWLKRTCAWFSPFHRKILELEYACYSCSRLQKVFVNSHMVKRELLHYYDVDPHKIFVFHNGVEWKELEHDYSIWPDRDPSRVHFLFAGNGYARKGLKPLLFALARLNERAIHLSVVGKEKQINYYQALTEQLNLSRQVTFFGPQSDLRPFYRAADILVVPSLYDPFANVTVEALAMGLFVVSSQSNGGHEILTPENGLVIPNIFDEEAFGDTLRAAMNHRKTKTSAEQIRNSARHLDYSLQLNALIDCCILPRA